MSDEYNYHLSIENKHTPGSLLLQKYTESLIHHSDFLTLIPFELDLTYATFSDTNIITYEIDLPPSENKIGFNLMDDDDFTIPYVTDKIPYSPSSHQLPTQATRNMWIIDINGEEPITSQGALDELN